MRRVLARFFRPTRRTPTQRATLHLQSLESRDVPSSAYAATGLSAGSAPVVTVQAPDGTVVSRFLAYDASFLGGVHAAAAELDGNPNTVEVVTGAGTGGGPHVKEFSVNVADGSVTTLQSFFAYDPAFTGGVFLGAGDVGTSHTPVIVTGAGPGGGPHVKVFTPNDNGTVAPAPPPILNSFMAFDINFRGGVSVAVGNFDGDETNGDELAVGAGSGGGPHVRVLSYTGAQLQSFMAFDPSFTGGVTLGAGPVSGALGGINGTGPMDNLVVAAGPGAGPQVNVYGFNGGVITQYNAFDTSYTGGSSVVSVTQDQMVLGAQNGSGAYTGYGIDPETGQLINPTILATGQQGLPPGQAPFGPDNSGEAGFATAQFPEGMDPYSTNGLNISSSTPV